MSRSRRRGQPIPRTCGCHDSCLCRPRCASGWSLAGGEIADSLEGLAFGALMAMVLDDPVAYAPAGEHVTVQPLPGGGAVLGLMGRW
jgi:hypothetical protein